MTPETPQQMYEILFKALIIGSYDRLARAALANGMTERDIDRIEREMLAHLDGADHFAGEFTTFETEPIVATVRREIAQLFDGCRTGRRQQPGHH